MFPHILPSQLEYVAEKILLPAEEGGPNDRMRGTNVL
jgi:hypothetical protein